MFKTNLNKVHIFCDVDGVINIYPDAPYRLEKGQVAVTVDGTAQVFPLHWRKEVSDFFSELSHVEVEFVWLTTWREYAPKVLDPLWNITSKGFMPWDNKLNDYHQHYKGLALEEWAKAHPRTPFIWIDDIALRSWETHSFSDRENVLGIMPYSGDGLTDDNLSKIKEFIELHKKDS
jgi:hypothetical protein